MAVSLLLLIIFVFCDIKIVGSGPLACPTTKFVLGRIRMAFILKNENEVIDGRSFGP